MDKSYFDIKPKGRYQAAIAKRTAKVLMLLCEQNAEFAQAIEQSSKTYQDCLDAVCKSGLGGSCDDLDVFKKAVKFYFSTATLYMNFTLDLCGDNGAIDPPITMHKSAEPMSLSLDSLLDF